MAKFKLEDLAPYDMSSFYDALEPTAPTLAPTTASSDAVNANGEEEEEEEETPTFTNPTDNLRYKALTTDLTNIRTLIASIPGWAADPSTLPPKYAGLLLPLLSQRLVTLRLMVEEVLDLYEDLAVAEAWLVSAREFEVAEGEMEEAEEAIEETEEAEEMEEAIEMAEEELKEARAMVVKKESRLSEHRAKYSDY
ncbi:hypothetical protein EG327_006151 [Venturia inaequalis]|uniref:Uncharacterized protein n=1 Tax=Venturia inaequalis TaxID=5025 RepID=A0A8H3Z0Y8_VENIN|nr:hypothetical protein EG327_006151 [Venturia inaequalis]